MREPSAALMENHFKCILKMIINHPCGSTVAWEDQGRHKCKPRKQELKRMQVPHIVWKKKQTLNLNLKIGIHFSWTPSALRRGWKPKLRNTNEKNVHQSFATAADLWHHVHPSILWSDKVKTDRNQALHEENVRVNRRVDLQVRSVAPNAPNG